MVEEIEYHAEWTDYIDILGHWEGRPNWKEILEKYRLQNTKTSVKEGEIFEK